MSFTSDLKIGKRIGGGSFGDVYEGTDDAHGMVAVKVLQKNTYETESDWATRSHDLLEEGKRMKQAEHDHVVRVFSILKATNGVFHVVAEYCNGGSLQNRYEQGPISLLTVRRIATDVTRGLAHIHSSGMLHRDIKPGNILEHEDKFKIGDFGLVTDKIIFGYASDQGYLDHLAPEVYSKHITSVKTDLWAFAMTLYRLLHGELFYMRMVGSKDVRSLVESGDFAKKLPWLPHIPDGWRRFIRRAMSDNPQKRFSSAHECGQALSGLPVVPDWFCTTEPLKTVWKRTKNGREITVSLQESGRLRSWNCYAEGNGKRTLSLGGDKNLWKPMKETNIELNSFFLSQR